MNDERKEATRFVLDCSVTMSWCFEDESNDYTDSILDLFGNGSAIVPAIWPLEVTNVLLIAERKKRLTKLQSANFICGLELLPISIDYTPSQRIFTSVLEVARKQHLTSYDAAYLEIALRKGIPISTFDKAMVKAAKSLSIQLAGRLG